ncbi:MAG TPA: alkaline phosphatase family protein [Candidatus Didemnitutus sp.]|nr:alkaline phosphatase family protein [Candidatus Didemnitutus sp.]
MHFFSPLIRRTLALLGLAAATSCLRADEAPALAVVISIDQFRVDYLERFRAHFSAGGFNLLLEQGADFVDCHQKHSYTKTAPGHAVMLTGVHANLNGIIANDWIDRDTMKLISAVGDTSVRVLGLPPRDTKTFTGVDDPYLPRSPKNLLVTTVGDELKLDRGGQPKVIGISHKHRAAILMSGRMADAAYFMELGRMITSTYYMRDLPEWVKRWNAARKVDAYFGKVWDRLLPAADYAVQGPDDAPGEDADAGHLGRTMPKTITGGAPGPGAAFYGAFENTPFANDVLEDFAENAIEHENLGGRAGITDLLCISFSANDHAGHLYGPDSHEVMDMVLRTDLALERFFKFLDRRIGLKRCVIVLTADHGAAPLPEWIHALHPEVPAGRIDDSRLLAAGEAALDRAFGPLANGGHWLVRDGEWLLLLPAALTEKGVASAAAQEVVRPAVLQLDFVQAAYTRDQLEKGEVSDALGRAALLSFNRARSGDVFYQPKPYFFSRATGSNHGSPYNYDTHVPLVWFGAAIAAGVHRERVAVEDLAPTLAHLLGLPAPPLSTGRVLF